MPGFYSSLAARLGAQVFAFEPDEENANSLRYHAELNALTPKIEIVRLAVDRCWPSVICEVHDAANALFVSD